MITMLTADSDGKAKEMIASMLSRAGDIDIGIVKERGTIKIIEKDGLKGMVTLEDKIIELEDALYGQKRGMLYRSILEVIEKPLIEYVLKRTEGNQLKAARVLGLNRNTIRSKIKRLGIDVDKCKAI